MSRPAVRPPRPVMTGKAKIVAHRGANREAPENTLEAFSRALEVGVHGIELDIQFTRDRIPVVHHDPVLRASGSPIAALTLGEIQEQSRAPTLDEVLELVAERCHLYIEIKAPAAVESVVERLRTRHSWCAVHSFDHRVVAQARTLDSGITTGILLVSYLIDIVGAMRAARANDVWQQADYIDRELVDRVHGADGRVFAWTVNNAARARELVDMGVDVVCTDVPRELVSAFTV